MSQGTKSYRTKMTWVVSRAAFKAGVADVRKGHWSNEWEGVRLHPGSTKRYWISAQHIYEGARKAAVLVPDLMPDSPVNAKIRAYIAHADA